MALATHQATFGHFTPASTVRESGVDGLERLVFVITVGAGYAAALLAALYMSRLLPL